MKVYKGKYSQVHLIASLTAGLSRYHDAFAVAVVDEVLEAIRVGLELNEYGMQQRRIAYMRFLGELYSYRLIDSPVIFDTLYLIIGYGHGTSEQDVLDPPEDCFRLRMVITLLETCGQFFDRGSSKRRLDRFLLYFQRYVLSKGVIPLDVEFDLQDLFADLRPKMVRYATYDEANQALLELEEVDRNLAASEKERSSRPPTTAIQADGEVHINQQASEFGKDAQNTGAAPLGTRTAVVHPDDGDSESETESGSMEADGQEEEEELEEEKYTFHEDEGDDELEAEELEGGADTAGSEEEEKVKVMQKKMPETDPAEEAEFDREYRALMQESIDSRKLEMRSRPTLNMTIPLNLFDSKDHGRGGGGTDIESGDEVVDDQTNGTSVQFRVLVKKGNKQQTKQLRIPRDCSLVLSTKQKEAAELEEKQDIKRLVLEYNERDEEDRAGTAPQPMNWASHQGASGVGRGRGGGTHWGDGGGRVGNAARHRRPVAAGGNGRRR
jgi:regulator of nonsense transcripts 2